MNGESHFINLTRFPIGKALRELFNPTASACNLVGTIAAPSAKTGYRPDLLKSRSQKAKKSNKELTLAGFNRSDTGKLLSALSFTDNTSPAPCDLAA
jgi:hypothetical protein